MKKITVYMHCLGKEEKVNNCIPEVLHLNIELRDPFHFLGTRNCDIVSNKFIISPNFKKTIRPINERRLPTLCTHDTCR